MAEDVVSLADRRDIFERYDSGLIAGFNQAHGTEKTTGVICAVTKEGIEVVGQYEQMNFDFRSTWAQFVNLFKGKSRE